MLVRLTDAWHEVLRRRAASWAPFPPPVRVLLGEMTAAGVLMQANIKFNGALVLQIFGDGPVKLAVAEVQPDLAFRATAKVVGEVPAGARLEALLNVHGQGRCAITLDPQDKLPGQQPYQGVVPLHGDQREPLQQLSRGAGALHAAVRAARHPAGAGRQRRGGRRPADPAPAGRAAAATWPATWQRRNEDEIGLNEDYNRIALLAATLTRDELLTLPADQVLHRLFWEEKVARFEPRAPRFACTLLARARAQHAAQPGPRRERRHDRRARRGRGGLRLLRPQYRFDAVDVGEMFTPQRDQPPASAAVQ